MFCAFAFRKFSEKEFFTVFLQASFEDIGLYQAVVKSSLSEDNHYVDFEIDVIELPLCDGYVIGLICVSVYGGILSAFAIFVGWKYFKARSYFSVQKGKKFCLFILH